MEGEDLDSSEGESQILHENSESKRKVLGKTSYAEVGCHRKAIQF